MIESILLFITFIFLGVTSCVGTIVLFCIFYGEYKQLQERRRASKK